MKPARVLVVDDHALNLKLLCCVLELGGLAVTTADCIAAAERALAASPPDLIVLDLRLPDGDGLALAQRCKSDPALAHCPIIACTAGAMHVDRERALEAGCDDYVSKPIDMQAFLAKVQAHLGRTSTATEAFTASGRDHPPSRAA